jgi:hypothetical protein
MPGSRASVFGEAEDFPAALSTDSVAGLLVTARPIPRAIDPGSTRRLATAEEGRPRIAFIAVLAGKVLVSFPIAQGPSSVWAGLDMRVGEILTFGPGQRLHARAIGRSHWGAIQLPEQELPEYSLALNEAPLVVPAVARWQPRPAAARQLRSLHRGAIRGPGHS